MSVLPHDGPTIAIFITGLFFAVVGAVIAMELQHQPVRWAFVGFVATIVDASALYVVI